jgi:ATP-dependent Clp protease protease subunit
VKKLQRTDQDPGEEEFEEDEEKIEFSELPNKLLSFSDEISKTLLLNRIVILTGEIDLDIALEATRELTYVALKNKSNKPIQVVLNSVGGEVYAGLLVYNTINDLVKRQGIQVNVEVRGLAASMGCIILQAGTKRISAKATRFLIHEVAAWDWGKVSEMEDKVTEIRQVNNLLRDIISERSGKPTKEIDHLWTKKDVWYSAKEALEFGLIDEIVD